MSLNPLYQQLIEQAKKHYILVYYNEIDGWVPESQNIERHRSWRSKQGDKKKALLRVGAGNKKQVLAKDDSNEDRFVIFLKAYRVRLLDWDNYTIKSIIDGIRRIGIIRDDNPNVLLPTVLDQEKVKTKEKKTVIHVYNLKNILL